MKNKKVRFAALIGLIASSSLMLGACGGANTTVATYSGGDVSQESFYQELKESPSSKTILANLLIYRALDQAYGKSVTDKQVDKA